MKNPRAPRVLLACLSLVLLSITLPAAESGATGLVRGIVSNSATGACPQAAFGATFIA